MVGELVDPQERTAALAQILDRQTEHRGEDQQRIDDQAGMTMGTCVRSVEVVRIEMERQGGEEGTFRLGNGAAPVMLEDPADLEILVVIALRYQPGTCPEILRHSLSINSLLKRGQVRRRRRGYRSGR